MNNRAFLLLEAYERCNMFVRRKKSINTPQQKIKTHTMKRVVIFILALLLGAQLNAQTTAIPDPVFEQYLVQVGIDNDGTVNGSIANSAAAVIDTLDLTGVNLTDLSGIEAFVNLKYLDCSYNSIASGAVDISSNAALVAFKCVDCRLNSLDLSNNLLLEELYCGYNQLNVLDLSAQTALTHLSCGTNSLTSLDVSNNTALKHLEGNYNNITAIDLTNNQVLERLYFGDNKLTNIDLSNNATLTHLYLNSNDLTSIDVSNITGLVELVVESNNISSIDVSANITLAFLDVDSNNLASLDLTTTFSLLALNCGDNHLTTLDISFNTMLHSLWCYGNNLTSIDLSNNLNLNQLDITSNNLTTLDISNNNNLVGLFCANNALSILDVSNAASLDRLNCNNNNLEKLDVSANPDLTVLDCTNNLSYLSICTAIGQNIAVVNKDASAFISPNCYKLAAQGRVAVDDNSNCLVDSIEQGLGQQMIRFERTTDSTVLYFSTHDSLGNYNAYLDTGIYTVTVIPSNTYWQGCPSSQTITIDTNYTLQVVDFSLQPTVLCPGMTVDISAPFLRMTGGGSAYTVSYCNHGTVAAPLSYVDVDLDPSLNLLNTTLPIANQIGTVYRFNLGTVGVGECGSFQLQVVVDTSAQFQQTHCTEVHIYPDSICDPNWGGPRVDGNVTCQNGDVLFVIQNIGAAMSQPQTYTIFEDNVAMRTGTVQLGGGQSTTITQTAALGSTYRIEVDQATGFPNALGGSIFSRVIEGCNPNPDGSFNIGFVTQLSNGHSAPFMAIDCQENIASYDPNDKAAQPTGYGAAHYIEQNVALDYKVRFQNTGTDTAFNIVILDTLSQHLDISSLQMGASSHAYNWAIIDGNVLRVSFPNIMLVDSNANEPLSHGFFRYRIEQQIDNPLGTIIENTAAIYFDYNPPIFTNTTFHTVGENFIPVVMTVENVYEEGVDVLVYPNPFDQQTTIEVKGHRYEDLQLSVVDVAGRLVSINYNVDHNQVQLSRGNLQSGIYFYQLKGDGVLINTGKIIIE